MYCKSSLLGHFKLSLFFREDSTAKDVSYLDISQYCSVVIEVSKIEGGWGGWGLSTIYIIT